MTVRQFSTDGKQLNAYLPRPTFPPGLEPGAEALGVSIRASNDRIGILANSGDSSVKQEWVELDLAGNVTERARVEGALRDTHLAVFTADGHVYLAGNPSSQVYTLDHATHTWKLIPKQGAGDLMGADGDSVVYEVYSQPYPSPIQLEWYRRP